MKKALLLTISFSLFAGAALAQDCCSNKADGKRAAKHDCCGQTISAEEQFMAEAARMEASATPLVGKKDDCCGSGCCQEKGAAKFKVFVAGSGYRFFDCEASASKARHELLAKSARVGPVQKVTAIVAAS